MPLSEQTQRSLERVWSAEADRAIGELPQAFKAMAATLNAKGLYRSGSHIKEIDRHVAKVLAIVANRMFEKLVEANESEQPKNVEDRIYVLQGIFGDRVSRFHGTLQALVHENNDKIGLTEERLKPHRTVELVKTFDYERRSLVERVRFAVTASAKKGTPMGNTVNITGSNVASVAVGDNAQAVAHQQVTQGSDSAAVIDALGQVIARIAESTVGSSKDREQVAKLLDELRAEAAKPAPDKWRVLGLIKGASEFVKFIPEAVAAWEVVAGWSDALMS